MAIRFSHRLEGLESDNLLAFLAMLGMLRSLEEIRPDWHPQVYWDIDKLPIRPVLCIANEAKETEVVKAIADGLARCAGRHDFDSLKDLKKLKPEDATRKLSNAVAQYEKRLKIYEEAPGDTTRKLLGDKRYVADLWASLISDVVTHRGQKEEEMVPTPFCLTAGRQHFLDLLSSVPQKVQPPARRKCKKRIEISEADCLREALFVRWGRLDKTLSFRWDPQEDVRYALCAKDPSKNKGTTQHGANRLAAVGLSTLTVFPMQQRDNNLQLGVLGGSWDRKSFTFTWPIWRYQASLASIRALLSHPNLNIPETRKTLGIAECRRARKISPVQYYGNFTRAIQLSPDSDL